MDLPTNEMRDDMPIFNGTCAEEIPPNALDNKMVSELAFQSVFVFQPEVADGTLKVEK